MNQARRFQLGAAANKMGGWEWKEGMREMYGDYVVCIAENNPNKVIMRSGTRVKLSSLIPDMSHLPTVRHIHS